MMQVHAAAIEWTGGIDTEVIVAFSEEELNAKIRSEIEGEFSASHPEWDPSGEPGFREWWDAEAPLIADFDDWYEELHERTCVPWVTRTIYRHPGRRMTND